MSASSADALSRRGGVPAGLCLLALLLSAWTDPAAAAVLDGMATSVGLLAALAAWLLAESWPERLPPDALPALVSVTLLFGVAWWARRRGFGGRVLGLVGTVPGLRSATPSTVFRLAAPVSSQVTLPAGIERAALMAELESHFVCLQTAWDACDLPTLRELATAEMLDELCASRAGCTQAAQLAPAAAPTVIVSLESNLLGFESFAETCVASVDFSGLARDSADGPALPFREVWMLVAPRESRRAWQLARHQALL